MSVRVKKGQTETLWGLLVGLDRTGLTGLSAQVDVWRESDGQFWTGSGYQASNPNLAMTEASASTKPGVYEYDFDTTNADVGPHGIRIFDTGGTAKNDPLVGEVHVGGQPGDTPDAYNGTLYFDSINGAAGAVVGVNGTPGNPCNSESDLRSLSTALGVRRVVVRGTLTLGATYDDFEFVGAGLFPARARVQLNSQIVRAMFRRVGVLQSMSGGAITAIDCDVTGGFGGNGTFYKCALGGTHTLDDNATTSYIGCWLKQSAAGFWAPSFALSSVGIDLVVIGFSGEITVAAMTANDTLNVDGWMTVIFNASCDGGDVTLGGMGRIIDNSTAPGVSINKAEFLESPYVMAHLRGRNRVVRGDPWVQEVYYPDDLGDGVTAGTLAQAYDLKKFDGGDIADTGNQNPIDDPAVAIAERDEQ